MNKRRLLIEKRGDGKELNGETLKEIGFVTIPSTDYIVRCNEVILFSDFMGHDSYMKPANSKNEHYGFYDDGFGSDVVGFPRRGEKYTINDFKRDVFSYYGIKKLTKFVIPVPEKKLTFIDKIKNLFK